MALRPDSTLRRNGDGTVNGNLRELYQQQVFESFNGNNEDSKAAPEPEEKLQHAQPTQSGVNMNADNRCKQASSGIAQQQFERLVAIGGGMQFEPVAREQGFEGPDVFGQVIDDEELDGFRRRHGHTPRRGPVGRSGDRCARPRQNW